MLGALAYGFASAATSVDVSIPSWNERYFSPNGDEQEDIAAVFYCLGQSANVTTTVTDDSGAHVRTVEDGVSHAGNGACWNNQVTWDGKDDAGQVVAAGVYTLRLQAVDGGGQTGEASVRLGVELRDPGALTSPAPGDSVSGTMRWTFTPTTGFPVSSVAVNCHSGGSGDLSSAPAADGAFAGSLDTAQCADGSNQIDAWASWQDPFGQSHSWLAPAVAVTVANPPRLSFPSWSERSFSPNGDDQEDTATVFYCLSEAAKIDATVVDTDGSRLRTLETGSSHPGSPSCASWNNTLEWDGRDDAGNVVVAGTYTLRLQAVDTSGQTGEASVRLGVELRAPGALTSPAAGDTVSGATRWVFTPTTGFPVDSVSVNCHSGSGWGDFSSAPAGDGTFAGTLDTTSCASGSNQIDAWVSWHDPFGQSHSWAAPSVQVSVGNPPRFTLAPGSERSFSPNNDDQEDTARVSYCLSEAARVTAKVTDDGGSLVRTLDPVEVNGSPSCSSFHDTMVWDGKDDAGQVVAAGVYTLRLQAGDGSGQTGEASVRLGVELRAPGALTSPAVGDTVSGTVDWVFIPTTGFPVSSVSVSCEGGGFLGSSSQAAEDGSVRGSGDSTGCQSGANKLTASVGWTDPFGQGHSWTAPTVEVTVGNPPQFTIASGSERYFSPNGDGQEDTTTVHYCLSETAKVTAKITDDGGSLVRTLEPADVTGAPGCAPGRSSVAWDGKDDAGQVVAAGQYRLRLQAIADGGQTAEATVRLGVELRAPGRLSSPAAGDTLAGLARFVFQPTDDLVPDEVQLSFDTGGSASIFNTSPDGAWRTSMYTGTLEDGPATLHTSVRFTDPLGATHWWSGPTVPVVIDVTSLPLTVDADPLAGPAPLNTTLKVTTSDPQGRVVRYTLDFGDGSAPTSGDIAAPYPTLEVPHTYAKAGAYRAVITVTNAAGSASTKLVNLSVAGTGNSAPTATLGLDTTSGSTPLPLTATIAGADADDDPLTYTLDFGDGAAPARGSLPQDPVDHTYSKAGTYLVRLAVSDGNLTAVKTATVVVALDEPLTANAGDDQVVIVDTPVRFDASGSRPTAGIDSYHWAFGDGTSADGPAVDHTYTKEGSYTTTLTVTAAGASKTDTAIVTVQPTPATPGLVVTVRDEGNNPVGGADLVVIDSDGQKFSATTDTTGLGHLQALPDGAYTVYGWKQGYLPANAKGAIVNHAGAASLTLKAGQVATSSVTATPMSYDEIVEAGIDPEDPANQHVYEFEIHLAFEPFGTDIVFTGLAAGTGSGRGFFPHGITTSGGEIPCTTVCPFTSGGYGGAVSINWVNDQPQLLWLVIPGKASWLKEFFSVQMLVTNLADPDFTLDHGAASLPLPAGLSLAPTTQPQHATVNLPDIRGGESAAASWVVRGDTEGSYELMASYGGTLEPFGATVVMQATAAKPLRVWGGSAVEMTVDADSQVYDRYPYRVRIGLTNKADVPIYNAAVELLKEGKINYLYQPREALEQGTAAIGPGDTFWTDDYILAPEITGELDLERSFVKKTAGDVEPPTKIVSHAPLQTPTTAPTLSAIGLKDRVGLLWDDIPGVTGYEIYSTPDRTTDFPSTPVQTVPAGTTSTTVTMPEGSDAWFAVSSIINGKRTLAHPIVHGQPSNRATLPLSQAKLSSTASCGADIGVSVQFEDPFFDLTSWSATLDGAPYDPGHGSLSGRRATASFTVEASDIKAGGSLLSITATDSSPATGPAWTGRISTACNPIRMLVVGDSIAWGQGLLDHDKYPNLVAEWLRQRTGRGVEYDVVDRNLAHSGAVVNPTGCTPDHRAASDWYDAGEVPMATPDIGTCQVAAAKTIPADLILVDGCINDVGVLNVIFNPLVDLSVVDKCSQQVTDMLLSLHEDHPNAKIVYTGYYQIVDRSLSLGELLTIARLAGIEKAAVAGLTGELLKHNSGKFDDAFRQQAIQSVERALHSKPGTWLEFADPGFMPGDGVFNPDSKLFLGANDPMRAGRVLSCYDAVKKLQSSVFCPIASIGHPNEAGARRYAAAIEKSLSGWAAEMGATPTVKGLKVSPTSVTLPKGDSQKLTITATYDDGSTGDASTLVTLTSDKPRVATADAATTTVRAANVGTAQITAALASDPTVKTSITVRVGDAVPRALTVTPANPLVSVDGTHQLAATVTWSDGTTQATTANSTWTSSNTAIATVSARGVVRGIRAGTASITATYRHTKTATAVRGSTVVTVLPGPPQITGFTPTSGPVGSQVTIRGANLLGVTSVAFGGTRSTQVTVNSSSSITAVVPTGAQTGFIRVRSPLGAARSPARFTVRN